MSSHHIIKEKQEPALYIISLGNFDDEQLGQLLEWSPTLIVQDSEYEKIWTMGIKADLIAGNSSVTALQEHTQIIDTAVLGSEAVLQYLIQTGYSAVHIIIDQEIPINWKSYVNHINVVFFDGINKIYPIRSGFSVWKPAGAQFSGLTNFLETKNLKCISEGHYEVLDDGFVEFIFKKDWTLLYDHI